VLQAALGFVEVLQIIHHEAGQTRGTGVRGRRLLDLPLRQDISDERMSSWERSTQPPQRTRRGFTKEFKRDAVELVRTTGRPIAVVARELGIYDSTLGNWVRQDRIDRGEAEGLTSEERARLRQLEADNARLRMERELLKRTVAFWVKEQSTP
jgi:transposase